MSILKNIPSDAAEMARLVRKADEVTAVRLLQIWGAKQREFGEMKAITYTTSRVLKIIDDAVEEAIDAQA